MLFLFIISFLMFISFHVVSSFTFSSQQDPSHLRWGFYTPFYTFSPNHRGVIRDTLFYDHFYEYLLAAGASVLREHYLPHRRFLPWRAFTDILTSVYYQCFSCGSSSLRFAGLHSYPRITGPAHLLV